MSKKRINPLDLRVPQNLRRQATVSILSNGNLINPSVELIEIQIIKKANEVPSAFLEIKDSNFEFCDDSSFIPGSILEIRTGYQNDELEVFRGTIVAHHLSTRSKENFLRLEVKHAAFILESGENSRIFKEMSDAEALDEIIEAFPNLSIDSTHLEIMHESLIQMGCSDWQFVVERAQANGCLIHTLSDQLSFVPLKSPTSASIRISPSGTLNYDLQLNSQSQFQQIHSKAWDYANQETTSHSSESTDYLSQQLAADLGNPEINLGNPTYIRSDEVNDKLDFIVNEMPLLAITGKIEINGTAEIEIGTAIALSGFGERLSRKVLVTGVTHLIRNGKWKTILTIGLTEASISSFQNNSNYGLQIGIISSLAGDRLGQHRIEVKLPMIGGESSSVWARPCVPEAGNMRGFHFRPEIGDEVIVSFFGGSPQGPVILGSLHSSAHPAVFEDSDDNHLKGIVTRSNLKFQFDDEEKVITIQTEGGNRISVSEEEHILIEDSLGNKIKTDSEGITLSSIGNIKLDATGDILLTGINITAEGSANVKFTGGASAELSSGGSTKVKGSLVQIN